jgi:hypothetical protein
MKPANNPFAHNLQRKKQEPMFNTPFSNTGAAQDTYATNNANWGQEEPDLGNNDDFNFVADPAPTSTQEELYYANQA